MSCENGKDLRVNTIMENGVGKKIMTCDDPSSPPPPTFCPGFPFCDNQGNGGIETLGSWPGVDTYRNWPFRPYRPWPLMWPGQQGYWPGQQGNWPGQRGSWRDQAYTWPLIWPGQQGNWPQPQVQQHWPTWRATWRFLPHLGRWVRSWWG